MVTDFEGGLVIASCNYDYPILVYDISRSDINDDIKKGVGFEKDVHAELGKTFAHRQANAVALSSTPFACLWRYQYSW